MVRKKLIQLLNDVCQLELSEQKQKIADAHLAHKQDEAQRDDITFVTLRL